MMLKIAHMRQNRKANKGFSLVELIIVMAIMVALVAVLAPQYIRYLQRSRDAVVVNSAEDVLTAVKTDIIDPQGHLSGSGNVVVKAAAAGSNITITSTLTYTKNNGVETADADNVVDYIIDIAGINTNKTIKSAKVVTIEVTQNPDNTYSFNSIES